MVINSLRMAYCTSHVYQTACVYCTRVPDRPGQPDRIKYSRFPAIPMDSYQKRGPRVSFRKNKNKKKLLCFCTKTRIDPSHIYTDALATNWEYAAKVDQDIKEINHLWGDTFWNLVVHSFKKYVLSAYSMPGPPYWIAICSFGKYDSKMHRNNGVPFWGGNKRAL